MVLQRSHLLTRRRSAMDKIEKARQVARKNAIFYRDKGSFRYSPEQMLKFTLSHKSESRDYIIEYANQHSWVFDATVNFCADEIEKGNALSEGLTKFIVSVLRGELKRPRQRGPHPSYNAGRNFSIAQSVHEVALDSGIQATRNDESKPLSACDVVAEAFRDECEIALSYESVKKIYLQVRRGNRW